MDFKEYEKSFLTIMSRERKEYFYESILRSYGLLKPNMTFEEMEKLAYPIFKRNNGGH